MLRLNKATVTTILRWASEHPTIEVCGLVWQAGEYQCVTPLSNVHADPTRYYAIDGKELVAAYASMDRMNGEPLAFYHSHPGGKPDPSEQDMLGAMNVGMHYLISYPWVPEFEKDKAALHGIQGPVWRLSVWYCLAMQILVEDRYEVVVRCRCGRALDKRGKTCCAMCWIGGEDGYRGCHSKLCRKRPQ